MHKQNKIITLLFVLLLGLNLAGNQKSVQKNERLEVHISQQLLFPGEKLWISVHSSGLSYPNSYSSLAYVELINKNNASIVRKKVKLKEGVGSNYLQLPDTLSSGNYTFTAYTQWMKNFGEDSFFRTTITIVNPGKPQKHHAQNMPQYALQLKENQVSDKIVFGQREKVSLADFTENDTWGNANYSVSVKRKEPTVNNPVKQSTVLAKLPHKIQYLPDYDGIIVSGQLLDPHNTPIQKQGVLLSLPGEKTDLFQSISDEKGKFFFRLASKKGNSDLVFTLPDPDMKIKLDDPFAANHSLYVAADLRLDSLQLKFIKEKYLHHQLKQNFGYKPFADNTIDVRHKKPSTFYTHPNRIIHTDNYVKLDSLREYFYELIPSVQFREVKGEYRIVITRQEGKVDLGPNPGVFVDGVYFSEYNNVAEIPVEKIDRIEVIWEKYYYKNFSFDGIVSIYTRKADFYSVELQDNMFRIIYPMADPEDLRFVNKKYHVNNLSSRVPDLRYLLLWEARVPQNKVKDLEFYTSDVQGIYEIKICGFADSGEWTNEIHQFEVK